MRISPCEWNKNVPENREVQYTAIDTDIVYRIGGLYCLCNKNGNLIAFSKSPDIGNIKALLHLCLILFFVHNVDYIMIEGKKGKWSRLLSRFKYLYEDLGTRELFAIKLGDNISTLTALAR